MENSNCNSDSEYFWCTTNHSPGKDRDKEDKDTVFGVTGTYGCTSSEPKSKGLVLYDDVAIAAASSSSNCHRHRNPRKRRSKLISFWNETTAKTDNDDNKRFRQGSNSSSKCNVHLKPKYVSKKPDPSAPKITRPCSECGKKFWSWKALFGHMRCHPERQWRGINPPPNFRRQSSSSPANKDDKDAFRYTECYSHPLQDGGGAETMFTLDEHEVAACLLLLANGGEDHVAKAKVNIPRDETTHNDMYALQVLNCQRFPGDGIHTSTGSADQEDGVSVGFSCGRFECSSCKKVFGSHQALGGHRASHKTVKGCFAITRTTPTSEDVRFVAAHHVLQDYQTQNHNHENYKSTGGGDYHCYQTDQSQSTTSVLLQEEETLDCKDFTTNATTDSKTATALGNGHECSICSRVFSSGQALGGHKRCHWEKGDNETLSLSQGMTSPLAVAAEPSSAAALNLKEQQNKKDLDLNLPAPHEDDSSYSYSSPLSLDLRLGI